MTTERETGRGARRGRGVLFSLLGLLLVAIPGFAIGLFAGVLWEDPSLILGDAVGGTQDVPWGPQPPPEAGAVAAQGPAGDAAPESAPAAESAPAGPASVSAPPPPAAPVPTATAAARPAPKAGGRFSIQVGAFAESRAAEELEASLRRSGLPVYVSPSAAAEGSQRWRVRVGPLATREEADKIAARLKSKEKLPTWVLSEDGA